MNDIIKQYPINKVTGVINPGGGIINGKVIGYEKDNEKVTHVVFITKNHPKDSPLITPVGLLLKNKIYKGVKNGNNKSITV